jgi:hypothetical protein
MFSTGALSRTGDSALRIESLLPRYAHLKVERPPLLWEPAGDEARVAELVDAMVAAVQECAAPLTPITLNVSNVVIESPNDGEGMDVPMPGEYVGLTVMSSTDLGPDATWHHDAVGPGLLVRLHSRLRSANAHFAYIRRIPPDGSITVLLRRNHG